MLPSTLCYQSVTEHLPTMRAKGKRRICRTYPQKSLPLPALSEWVYDAYSSLSNAEIAKRWDEVVGEEHTLLSSSYLLALEAAPPAQMRFCYVLVGDGTTNVAVFYFQYLPFRAAESFKTQTAESTITGFRNRLQAQLGAWLKRRLKTDLLIGGNALLTGEHGMAFAANVSKQQQLSALEGAIASAKKHFSHRGLRTRVTMLKDFAAKAPEAVAFVPPTAYTSFQVQPRMVMKLPQHWHSFDDYLEALHSKYRVRVRRAFKKGEGLQRNSLSLAEIGAEREHLHRLYKIVADHAGFNLFYLHLDYFYQLKARLGEKFQLIRWSLNGETVAFHTMIENGGELEAHFLGIAEEPNREYQIYFNVLLNIIEHGIASRQETINFARTALEIKSSVGAVAEEMLCAIRHDRRLANSVMAGLLHRLNEPENWQPRHPFKDGQEAEH